MKPTQLLSFFMREWYEVVSFRIGSFSQESNSTRSTFLLVLAARDNFLTIYDKFLAYRRVVYTG